MSDTKRQADEQVRYPPTAIMWQASDFSTSACKSSTTADTENICKAILCKRATDLPTKPTKIDGL